MEVISSKTQNKKLIQSLNIRGGGIITIVIIIAFIIIIIEDNLRPFLLEGRKIEASVVSKVTLLRY